MGGRGIGFGWVSCCKSASLCLLRLRELQLQKLTLRLSAASDLGRASQGYAMMNVGPLSPWRMWTELKEEIGCFFFFVFLLF